MIDKNLNFTLTSLQSRFNLDKELVVVLPASQAIILRRMMDHLLCFDKANEQNKFKGITGKFKKLILLTEGICLSVFTSYFFSKVANVFSFFALNKMIIETIIEEKVGKKEVKIVYIRR